MNIVISTYNLQKYMLDLKVLWYHYFEYELYVFYNHKDKINISYMILEKKIINAYIIYNT